MIILKKKILTRLFGILFFAFLFLDIQKIYATENSPNLSHSNELEEGEIPEDRPESPKNSHTKKHLRENDQDSNNVKRQKNVHHDTSSLTTPTTPPTTTQPVHSFNYQDKSDAQNALGSGHFCEKIDNELLKHFGRKDDKTYFCSNSETSNINVLKNKLKLIDLISCQEDRIHTLYQRCNTRSTAIEGCTGNQKLAEHHQKKTNVVTIIYNPKNRCIVNAFPPATIHLNENCSSGCQ